MCASLVTVALPPLGGLSMARQLQCCNDSPAFRPQPNGVNIRNQAKYAHGYPPTSMSVSQW